MATTTRRTNDAALHAYIVKIAQVRRLLARLEAEVEAHQDALDPEEIHWAHVGDMQRYITGLNDVLGNED